MTRKVQYEYMVPEEIIAARQECPVAFVPIGPLEWHGPHLPMGVDGLHAHWLAIQLAKRIGGVALPAFHIGSDTMRKRGTGRETLDCLGIAPNEMVVGMDFPGFPVKSTYFEEGVFAITIREIVRNLKSDGWKLVVLVNGHGAPNHAYAARRVTYEESIPGQFTAIFMPAWSRIDGKEWGPGHADKWETSLFMGFAAEHTHLEKLPPREGMRYADTGIVDDKAFDGYPSPGFIIPESHDPRHSTKEEGDQLLAEEIRNCVEIVQRHLKALDR